MVVDGFEVKTGRNRGWYIVLDMDDDQGHAWLTDHDWGWMDYVAYYWFYRYHDIDMLKQRVYTLPKFATHEFNQTRYAEAMRVLAVMA